MRWRAGASLRREIQHKNTGEVVCVLQLQRKCEIMLGHRTQDSCIKRYDCSFLPFHIISKKDAIMPPHQSPDANTAKRKS